MGPFLKEMITVAASPGTPRRYFGGQETTRRNITLAQSEDDALEVRAAELNTSVSELLVSSALNPQSRVSKPELKALIGTLNATRTELAEMQQVMAAATEGSPVSAELTEQWRAANVRLYNAVEALALS